MTPEQVEALSVTCAQFGEDFDSLRFDQHEGGFIGAFVGPAYAECSPAGEVTLWCDCAEDVPYGSCVMCPTCGSHLESCQASLCDGCGRCETACEQAGDCPGYD
ncbi:hypothetical protein [Nonomuraea sp. NPDC050202]|uniref:hypothetical protein n=1 Tax=Nonomuraea sp. NPDC050202 TaxID=3155035 RepID=UPI0033D71E02